ncbi:hypothetical protein D3C87_253250 [compost metagenome]
MKTLILGCLILGLSSACSQTPGAGGSDFSSTDGDITYHNYAVLNDPSLGDGAFTYIKIEMKQDQTFTQEEYISEDGVTGKSCKIAGTWDLPSPDESSTTGPELVVNLTTVNGSAPTTATQHYDLKVLSYETLKMRLPSESADSDLTNKVYVPEYSELQPVNLGAFTPDTFCDR